MFLTSCSEQSSDHLPVLTDTACRFSFSAPTGSFWFVLHCRGQIPNSLGKSNSIRSGIAQRNDNRHVRWDLLRRRSEVSESIYSQVSLSWWPTTSDNGQHSGRNSLKNRLWKQWQITRDSALKAEVNCLKMSVTRRLDDWRNDQWSSALESLDPEDQSLWRVSKWVMRVLFRLLPVHPRGKRCLRLWESGSLCRKCGGSVSASDRSCCPGSYWECWHGAHALPYAPASEPKLTNPEEIQEAIRGLKFRKSPGPNGNANRALNHLPQGAVSLMVLIFNAILLSITPLQCGNSVEDGEGSSTALILSVH